MLKLMYLKVNSLLTTSYSKGIYIISFVYIIAIILFLNVIQPTLIYEWADIVPTLIKTGEYKYLGRYSAFMPPLYPYYIKFFASIFGLKWGLYISIIVQCIAYLISLLLLLKVQIGKGIYSGYSQIVLVILLFFPAIFFGLIRNSSFGLTTSVYILSFYFSLRYMKLGKSQYLIFFLLTGLIGFYLRWDFVAYFLFMFIYLLIVRFKSFKISWLPFLISIMFYLPWSIRNSEKIGTYAYNTAAGFNLSKGNSLNFKSLNQANSPDYTGINSTIDKNEKLMDSVFKANAITYIRQNPMHFITKTVEKFLINFTQFFPATYNGIYIKTSYAIGYVIASVYSIGFVLLFVWLLKKLWKDFGTLQWPQINAENYFRYFILVSFIFHYIINTILAPPLPRYILFYLPFFMIYILLEKYLYQKPQT